MPKNEKHLKKRFKFRTKPGKGGVAGHPLSGRRADQAFSQCRA